MKDRYTNISVGIDCKGKVSFVAKVLSAGLTVGVEQGRVKLHLEWRERVISRLSVNTVGEQHVAFVTSGIGHARMLGALRKHRPPAIVCEL